jgi:hypothetical protein
VDWVPISRKEAWHDTVSRFIPHSPILFGSVDSFANKGAGTLFGLAIVPGGNGVYFVDDGTNTLNVLD